MSMARTLLTRVGFSKEVFGPVNVDDPKPASQLLVEDSISRSSEAHPGEH
jgi:hypothetical protein